MTKPTTHLAVLAHAVDAADLRDQILQLARSTSTGELAHHGAGYVLRYFGFASQEDVTAFATKLRDIAPRLEVQIAPADPSSVHLLRQLAPAAWD